MDSSNPIYLPELREMLVEKKAAEMRDFCATLHPARTAEFMEGLNPEEIWGILREANLEHRVGIFDYFPLRIQVEILERAPRNEFVELLEHLPSDSRVELIRESSPDAVEELLKMLPPEHRHNILRLKMFPVGSCGSEMSTDFLRLNEAMTVEQAIAEIGKQTADLEMVYYLFVVDARDHLVGLVSARQLLAAIGKPTRLVRDIMKRDLITVGVYEDRVQAAKAVAKYDFLAVPVVDREHHILGIITHDDVIDVIREEATEDAHQLGGVMPMEANYLEVPFLTIWKKRIPWLVCLFIAELLTFSALAHFEDEIGKLVVLAMFVPLCISTGGNSGSQAATLITRSMALGQIRLRDWLRVFRHEILMGIALGLSLGAVAFIRATLTPESVLDGANRWLLGITICQAVAAICLFGSVVGAMLPIVFRRLGVDPAVASTPFVATFVDVSGIIIYFSIAKFWLLSAPIIPPTELRPALEIDFAMTRQVEAEFYTECNRFFATQSNDVKWYASSHEGRPGARLTFFVKNAAAMRRLTAEPSYENFVNDPTGRWKPENTVPFQARTVE